MLFDVHLDEPTAGTLFPVRATCPTCQHSFGIRIWNVRWNQFNCPRCRASVRQFTNACPATIDPVTRQVGHVSAAPARVDWRAYGPMGQCLGPGAERRVLLCLQMTRRGLAGRWLTLRCTARRRDSGQVIGSWDDGWVPCRCTADTCRHNRFVRWLPPDGVWDQNALECEVQLLTAGGQVLFDDRLNFDVSPPRLGASSSEAPEPRPEQVTDQPTEAEVIERFHNLYYYGSPNEHQVWVRTFWMNVPCIQCPLDLWVYQEIISELRPDLIIETGTLLGGTTLFLAQMLDLIGKGSVMSIDLEDLPRPAHPRIEYVGGSSSDGQLVHRLLDGRPVDEMRLVILDSDHSKKHVLAEMRLFAPYVPIGSYLIVTDSNVNGHPVFPSYGPGPYEAVEDFLRECDEFEIDCTRQKHKLTFNPNGYLKRVKPAQLFAMPSEPPDVPE
jgi:cephalosporin hydroxylase